MLDHWSTQFLELQRETHRGAIGRAEYDRRTYAVLYGEDGSDEPAPRRRAAVLVAAAASAAGVIGAAVWVMVSLSG
jgi:hypothetical protein